MGVHKFVKEFLETKVSVPSGILLHTCCAPCTTYVRPKLEENGFSVTGFFYNPNIHPYTEYEKRLSSLKLYAALTELPMIFQENYELEEYLEEIEFGQLPKRCEICYRLRLGKTAQAAQENGFEFFSTTLLISPHQKHELLKSIGEEIAAASGLKFYYEDFRSGFSESRRRAREMNLYRQKYCGCLFSEKETFFKK